MPNLHAKLSASSAHRWLACPPILALEEDIADRNTTYAAEGTEAHTLSELKLRLALDKNYEPGSIELFQDIAEYYNEEMEEMTELFKDQVIEVYNGYDNAMIEFEQRVSYDKWAPGGFGTSDVVIATDKTIEIIDLKYGKGVMVDAEQNPQLMLYALGSYSEFEWLFDFETVRMTIIQPRLDHISTFEVAVEELLYWANNYVAPRAAQAEMGIGEWNINEDVMKFSKVRATLRPRAENNFKIIQAYDFEQPQLLELDEIAEILKQSKEIQSWLKDVEYYALEQARDHGKKIPGFKLVEGRSNRKITDEEALAARLESAGFKDIYKPVQMESMTKLEKLVGKKQFAELADEFIIKPEGKPTLVKATDKRPEIGSFQSAIDDFSN